MALPKPKIEQDSPAVIAAKEMTMAIDESIVLVKTNGGAIVMALTSTTYKWSDGKLRHFAPWTKPVPESVRESLVPGGAEGWAYRWIYAEDADNLASQRGRGSWEAVRNKENLVYCPYAVGAKTDGHIHWRGSMLHKRPRDMQDQERANLDLYLDQQRDPKRIKDSIDSAVDGRVTTTIDVEAVPGDAVTKGQNMD